MSEDNMRLLQIQNPNLASEEIWAHATAAPERGGLLLARADGHLALAGSSQENERYWQVGWKAQEGRAQPRSRGWSASCIHAVATHTACQLAWQPLRQRVTT